MTEIGGMNLEMKSRKRKLHFNWDDVYQSSSEDEKNIIKKKVSSKGRSQKINKKKYGIFHTFF